MTNNAAILSVIGGTVAIVAGISIKQFYASDMHGQLGRPIARWKGQLMFVGIGILFLVVGIAHLFTDH
ncbi:MAG: hypothetical protein ABR987_14065 [Terracidiphilus sp.]|jgi:hypothetical protein